MFNNVHEVNELGRVPAKNAISANSTNNKWYVPGIAALPMTVRLCSPSREPSSLGRDEGTPGKVRDLRKDEQKTNKQGNE